MTIYPSNDDDGDFYPARDSRIFFRLNNQRKKTNLTDRLCPTFSAGEKQTFQIDLIQNNNEKPKTLTIGYVNSDITATKWKLQKVLFEYFLFIEKYSHCRLFYVMFKLVMKQSSHIKVFLHEMIQISVRRRLFKFNPKNQMIKVSYRIFISINSFS